VWSLREAIRPERHTKSPFTVDKLKPGIYFYKIDCHSELVPALSVGREPSQQNGGQASGVPEYQMPACR
jgi:hypothetical protein